MSDFHLQKVKLQYKIYRTKLICLYSTLKSANRIGKIFFDYNKFWSLKKNGQVKTMNIISSMFTNLGLSIPLPDSTLHKVISICMTGIRK